MSKELETNKIPHSPTPWKFDHSLNVIRDAEGSVVGDIYLGQDTDLVIEAVNSFVQKSAEPPSP